MNQFRFHRSAALAAIVAGFLFIGIQPIHPPETLASVSTNTWAVVHVATLVMTILFGIGVVGIQSRQSQEAGLLGRVGLGALGLGLLLTAGFVFVEAFISPVLVDTDPEFVEALLAVVAGTPTSLSLGAIPVLWSASGMSFLGGCLVFGTATLKAKVLPGAAAALFGFGLPVSAIVTALLPFDLHRMGAAPIGLGLAWMGFALWADMHAGGSAGAHLQDSTGETARA